MPDNPSMAPETSRNEVHLANEQNSILIRWSLVVNLLIYLSELLNFTEVEIICGSIKEISCPKTEEPKKCVVLLIVV